MNCFDRDLDCARLWRRFESGKNVLMLAPRRVGKTVLLNRLKGESEAHGFHAVILDVEGFRDEKAFFRQMCAAIQEEIGFGQAVVGAFTDRLKRAVQGAENQGDWRNILLNVDWTVFADHLLGQLEAGKDGKRWLFLVDEIPVFVRALLEKEGAPRVHDFLYTLRKLCRQHPKVLWLYTGSIGLDSVARRNGLEGSLVDMEIQPLEPFERDCAADFVRHIVKKNGRDIRPEAVEAILVRLGWLSPYYLEKIAEAACDRVVAGQPIDVEVAERAANSLLDLAYRTYWATWREHLDKNFQEPQRTCLFTILAEIAHSSTGAEISTLLIALNSGGREPMAEEALRDHLDTLEADGYLSADASQNRFRFRMNLLREWWRRYVAPKPTPESNHG